MKKPIIAITMGDASGIGPELITKVLSREEVYGYCNPFVIGDPNVMEEISRVMDGDLYFKAIRDISEADFRFANPDVLCPEGANIPEIRWGKLDPAMGKAAALYLERASTLALEKKIDGIVSAPLNKEAFHRAGYHYVDELEYLAELTKSPEPFVMGLMDSVWTLPVTFHIPFRDIADMIKKERVLRYIRLMDETLRKMGLLEPKIAVAALNVHGGEGGLFGREEIGEIKPAVEEAQKLNVKVQGPFPADTIFVRATDGEFHAVVCMYHDQANIARKLYARRKGVTLFMGLPVPYGTTAHGTAFDIAGKGIANPSSLQDSLKYTAILSS
ncbi:MAG: 4-phospho-D-threonate 3-dehydrogenase [Proteobacteria bacterium]|nr:4-phospho-D-threonate 3-dehydrogenase [Pseudomonadota bacterium]